MFYICHCYNFLSETEETIGHCTTFYSKKDLYCFVFFIGFVVIKKYKQFLFIEDSNHRQPLNVWLLKSSKLTKNLFGFIMINPPFTCNSGVTVNHQGVFTLFIVEVVVNVQ